MASNMIEISKYKFEHACEVLNDARLLLKEKGLKSLVNRLYYAISHALRSVTALDGFDSSKHSGVIAYFDKAYVKGGFLCWGRRVVWYNRGI